MSINDCCIPLCDKYKINLITREITSHKGKRISTYLNKLGKETVQMACETGKRKTMLVDTIMRLALNKVLDDVYNTASAGNKSIEEEVIITVFGLSDEEISERTTSEVAELVKSLVPEADMSVIGRILSKR